MNPDFKIYLEHGVAQFLKGNIESDGVLTYPVIFP